MDNLRFAITFVALAYAAVGTALGWLVYSETGAWVGMITGAFVGPAILLHYHKKDQRSAAARENLAEFERQLGLALDAHRDSLHSLENCVGCSIGCVNDDPSQGYAVVVFRKNECDSVDVPPSLKLTLPSGEVVELATRLCEVGDMELQAG